MNFVGLNGVPRWEPSQNGCFDERPQAHQKYVCPAFTSTRNGFGRATTGVSIGPVLSANRPGVVQTRFRLAGLIDHTATRESDSGESGLSADSAESGESVEPGDSGASGASDASGANCAAMRSIVW